MAVLKFNDVGMSAIAACVPPKVYYNKDLNQLMPQEDVEKLIKSIGIEQKRFAEPEEVAKVVYFLISSAASYVNSSVIKVPLVVIV